MLYDDISVEQIVDTESAMEFMKEATKLASSSELESIGQKLEAKANIFQTHLNSEAIDQLDEEKFALVLSHVFGLRRKSKRLFSKNKIENLRPSIKQLLEGDAALEERFTTFVMGISGFDPALVNSLASELLHFTYPDKYWLWSPWIWEESKNGGALPLVVQAKVELEGSTPGEKYLSIGRAMKIVDALGHHRGYSGIGKGMFGTDIFLACVYAVYMYTVFRMKLSQEFNRILPELTEMTQRVLGIYQLGKA